MKDSQNVSNPNLERFFNQLIEPKCPAMKTKFYYTHLKLFARLFPLHWGKYISVFSYGYVGTSSDNRRNLEYGSWQSGFSSLHAFEKNLLVDQASSLTSIEIKENNTFYLSLIAKNSYGEDCAIECSGMCIADVRRPNRYIRCIILSVTSHVFKKNPDYHKCLTD